MSNDLLRILLRGFRPIGHGNFPQRVRLRLPRLFQNSVLQDSVKH